MLLKLASSILVLAVAACGGGSSSSVTTPKTVADTSDPSCPVAVPGTSVSVEDTPTGAALVFVTTGDVAEVRRRVSAMASMHNDHHGSMGSLPGDAPEKDAGHAGHDMSGHAGHDTSGHAGHDMSGHAGHDMSGHAASGGSHAGHAGGMVGVHSKATAGDVEGGAKLIFTASPADTAKLQSELRMHAQHFAAGTCGMPAS